MKQPPELSKSELEIARILWQLGDATVRQVFESMPTGRDVDFATVQTFLRRLEAKGYAKTRLEGRVRVYSARMQPKTVIKRTVEGLVDRLFGGESLPLIRHLIEDRGITDVEIAELRQMLDRMEKEAADDAG